MKRFLLELVALCSVLCLAASCSHVELARESDPNRVVTGTVNVRMGLMPPPDSEVVVRIVEPADLAASSVGSRDLVIGARGTTVRPERVIAEQVIRSPEKMPVPFRLEFSASDAALRHGLNVEARISWGGRVRFRTVHSQVITPGSIGEPQAVWLDPVP